jgi:hypothetical protein
MRKLALAAAVALATGCSDPLLFAELEIPSVRVTIMGQSFPATSVGPDNQCTDSTGAVVANCIHQQFTYDLGSQVSILNDSGVTAEVRLSQLAIALSATCDPATQTCCDPAVQQCIDDFRNVKEVKLWIEPPTGSGLQPTVLAEYTWSAADPTPAAISVSGYSNVDLAAFLDAGVLTMAAEMKYDQGTPDFVADVTGDFYLKVQLDYSTYL